MTSTAILLTNCGEKHQAFIMETLIPMGKDKAPPSPAARVESMGRWRKLIFVLMTRNAQSATAYFNLPPNRVVELGAQLQF